jgi:hypothetical protein
MNIEKVRAEVFESEEQKLQFNKKYCNPPLDYSKYSADIKYNETAILRENLILEKKKKQDEEALEKIILEKKDTKDFELWKKQMEENDNKIKLEEVAKRKIMIELSKENTEEL